MSGNNAQRTQGAALRAVTLRVAPVSPKAIFTSKTLPPLPHMSAASHAAANAYQSHRARPPPQSRGRDRVPRYAPVNQTRSHSGGLRAAINSRLRSISPSIKRFFSVEENKERKMELLRERYLAEERAARMRGEVPEPDKVFGRPEEYANYLRELNEEERVQQERERKIKAKISAPISGPIFEADYAIEYFPLSKPLPTWQQLGMLPPDSPESEPKKTAQSHPVIPRPITTFQDFLDSGIVGPAMPKVDFKPKPKREAFPKFATSSKPKHRKNSSLSSIFRKETSPFFECAGFPASGTQLRSRSPGQYRCNICREDTAHADGECDFCDDLDVFAQETKGPMPKAAAFTNTKSQYITDFGNPFSAEIVTPPLPLWRI